MGNWNESSSAAWKSAWSAGGKDKETGEYKPNNLGSTISGLAGGITGIVDAGMKNAEIADTSGIQSSITDTASTTFGAGNYDSLLNAYNPMALQFSNYTGDDVRGVSGGEMAMNTISGAMSGASTGAQIGGPWGAVIGAAVGLGSGIGGIFAGNEKARVEADRLNAEAEDANRKYMQSFSLSASNIGQSMFSNAALNLAAEGGQLDTYDQSKVLVKNHKMKHKKSRYKGFGNYYAYGGQMMSGDWSNGVVTIDEGGTHEKNPMGGVPMGVDNQGVPNLVEEGEVIFNDYVYSNRLKPTSKQLEEMHLDPKLEGLTFAEAAKKVSEESELRPMDNISKNTLVDGLAKLTVMQEETRMKKERAKMLRTLRHMAIQEPQVPQGMQEEVPVEGVLPIENQGVQMPNAQFAEHTPRAYKQIQEEMPDQYAHGGMLANYFDTGSRLPIVSKNIADFEYWDAANNDYNKEYKDWINTYDLTTTPKWGELSKLYKDAFGRDLSLATARKLALDKKYGNFHTMAGDMYKTHLGEQSVEEAAATDPVVRYMLRGADANGLPNETEITDYDPSSGKYLFDNTVTKDNVTTHYFKNKAAPEFPEYDDPADDNPETPLKNTDYPKPNILQFMPAIGSAITSFASLFQKPDYSNADRVAASRRNVRRVSSKPVSGYLGFNPYDTNFQQNKLNNQTAGLMRSALNTTSGNRAAAMTNLLVTNAKGTEQSGDIYRQALEFNDAQRLKVGAHNADINKFNSQQGLQADIANQSTDLKLLDNVLQEAKMRDSEAANLAEARNDNLSSMIDNLGTVGNTLYASKQYQWMVDNGYIPGVGNADRFTDSGTTGGTTYEQQKPPTNSSKNGGRLRRSKRRRKC